MTSERNYQPALTLVPDIGDVHAKVLIQHYGQASAIFKAKRTELEKIEGVGEVRASTIKEFTLFAAAEKELAFAERYRIRLLFLTDSDYPKRPLNCCDPPHPAFLQGHRRPERFAGSFAGGTRKNTEYGKKCTESLISELADENVTIVSGLAYGIDAKAHKAALKCRIPTVGVVGHGLDKIYPPEHVNLARDMVREGGGILSEFFSSTEPDKFCFPLRNRIMAGMSDAAVVVETGQKRRQYDHRQACRRLQPRRLCPARPHYRPVEQWLQPPHPAQQGPAAHRRPGPAGSAGLEANEKETVHIDEINLRTTLSGSTIAATILNLELQNIITSLPGRMYKLS